MDVEVVAGVEAAEQVSIAGKREHLEYRWRIARRLLLCELGRT